MSRPVLVMSLFLVGLALSGCIGGEDTQTPPTNTDDGKTAEDAVATADTGSLTGKIVTAALEPVEDATVTLIKGGSGPLETMTRADGTYTLNEIPPGTYIAQFSKATYKEVARSVQIEANKVLEVNMQIEKLSDAELGLVYADGPNSMQGFLGCGAGFAVNDTTRERGASLNPCFYDENSKNVFEFEVGEGLKTLLIGLTWSPAGGVSGERLNIGVETNETEENLITPKYTYAKQTDRPDIILRIDEDDITDPDWKWSNITGSQTIQVRVFPGMSNPPTAIYQQTFTVWWQAWYNGEAPEDASPIPDQ